ncbi:uncharacterized protein C8R40DRAFT_558297 [Lentinula edodes]|uniref:uncharacterized protein n=1 Tax=Lentinula edodes TaxID=5353 RepID=UPI001E8CE1DA|nr:uncharacterized protein C8R40DRAFT_558297 [Lentinula edodes]KAH7871493.1 hypothetical protein C8R40DRAFT_558297 [Lentinula edodes]
MSNASTTAVVYNASVNPSRRAKVTRMTERTILPRQMSVPQSASNNAESESTMIVTVAPEPNQGHVPSRSPTTAKRGRKPASNASGLSRSAREAQRKLNHSIIEKARRTKINEALAELARLGATVEVLHSGGSLKDAEASVSRLAERPTPDLVEDHDVDADVDDDDDKDGDYGVPSSSRTRNGGSTSKIKSSNSSQDHISASKGKEKFKLDILVKTVENMQHLLERVRSLEAQVENVRISPFGVSEDFECRKCAERTLADLPPLTSTTNKRKRHTSAESDAASNEKHLEDFSRDPDDRIQPRDQRKRKVMHTNPSIEHTDEHTSNTNPILPTLPSISSWLSDYNLSAYSIHSSRDSFTSLVAPASSSSPSLAGPSPLPRLSPFNVPQHRGRFHSNTSSPSLATYLPSPPSSTQFTASAPVSYGGVPILELGPSSASTPCAVSSTASPAFSIRGRPGSSLSISTNAPSSAAVISPGPVCTSTNSATATIASTAATGRIDTIHTVRTPEDESAASLLLHMKSSPPVFMTPRARRDSILSAVNVSDIREDVFALVSHTDSNGQSVMIAQTPSSILGLGPRSD